MEYEGLYLICFACGKYGHKCESCLKKGTQVPQPNPLMVPTLENPYGPWMLPKNTRRRFSPQPSYHRPAHVAVESYGSPDTLIASRLGHSKGPVNPVASKPTKLGDNKAGPKAPYRTRFNVLN